MKDRHYAYLAGLIDGDGCFAGEKTFQKRSNCFQYNCQIEVTTKIRTTTTRLIELFGGTANKNIVDNVVYWKWISRVNNNSITLLQNLSKYLILKKGQCNVVFEWASIPRYANVPEVREDIIARLKYLNQNHPQHLEDLPETTDKQACSYLAGLIDAEGTISIVESGTSYLPYICVYNDSLRILEWCKREFGGCNSLHKKPNHYTWRPQGTAKDKERFLLSILPYLITKRDQASVLLKYVRMFKRKDPESRKVMYEDMWSLNHPGTSEANTPNTFHFEVKTESDLVGDYESVPTEMLATQTNMGCFN